MRWWLACIGAGGTRTQLSTVDNAEDRCCSSSGHPHPDGGGARRPYFVPPFRGTGLEDDTPDYSTISRFRTELANALADKLFHELGRQLEKRGLFVKEGSLMDATLVEAQVKRPPMSAGPGAKSTRDPDADWSRSGRGSRTHFGYKAHIGVDEGTGLVPRRSSHPPRCMRARGGRADQRR